MLDPTGSTLPSSQRGGHFANMQFSWISIYWFLQIPILAGSYRSSECLVRMNYHLNGKGNVVIVGFFPAFAAYPLNKTTDWRMTKFTKEFMIEWVLYTFIYSLLIFDILMAWKRTDSNIIIPTFYHFKAFSLLHFYIPLQCFFLVNHLVLSKAKKEFKLFTPYPLILSALLTTPQNLNVFSVSSTGK